MYNVSRWEDGSSVAPSSFPRSNSMGGSQPTRRSKSVTSASDAMLQLFYKKVNWKRVCSHLFILKVKHAIGLTRDSPIQVLFLNIFTKNKASHGKRDRQRKRGPR